MKNATKSFCVLLAILMSFAMLPGIVTASFADGLNIASAAELDDVIADLNANGGSKTVVLTEDISCSTAGVILSGGELTILGEGRTLTATIRLQGSAVLNLGGAGYGGTLTMLPSRSDSGVFDLTDTSVLNIYDGTTIGPCSRIGTAGGAQAHLQSVVNMYGGTITGCSSSSVAGGVYLDGNSVFNLYGGTISDCTGMQGGAVGLSGALRSAAQTRAP